MTYGGKWTKRGDDIHLASLNVLEGTHGIFLCAGCEPAENDVHPAGHHSRDLHHRGEPTGP